MLATASSRFLAAAGHRLVVIARRAYICSFFFRIWSYCALRWWYDFTLQTYLYLQCWSMHAPAEMLFGRLAAATHVSFTAVSIVYIHQNVCDNLPADTV